MKIHEALTEVMKAVGAVRKSDRNTQQNFSFRGVDAVTSAVFPALTKHGVVVIPKVLEYKYGTVCVGRNRTEMGHVQLTVEFKFVGPEGDSVESVVAAESMDAGDKATAKAHSVAFRTALLQTLCLPTDEPDPDSTTYQRSEQAPEPSPEDLEREAAINDLGDACAALGLDARETAGRFYALHKKPVRQATPSQVRKFIDSLHDEAEKKAPADVG
ncbi:ERF family protein [Mycobacterium kansasii]